MLGKFKLRATFSAMFPVGNHILQAKLNYRGEQDSDVVLWSMIAGTMPGHAMRRVYVSNAAE